MTSRRRNLRQMSQAKLSTQSMGFGIASRTKSIGETCLAWIWKEPMGTTLCVPYQRVRVAFYDGIRRTGCGQSLGPFEDRKILAQGTAFRRKLRHDSNYWRGGQSWQSLRAAPAATTRSIRPGSPRLAPARHATQIQSCQRSSLRQLW
jgi:hypothetical protein